MPGFGRSGSRLRRGRAARVAAIPVALALVAFGTGTADAALVGQAAREWWLTGSLDYSGAWAAGEGDGVTVAVVGDLPDTSVPDLSGSFATPLSFPPGLTPIDLNPSATECLSTEVSSLIAGHGHSAPGGTDGILGLAPHARILPIAVALDPNLFADSAYTAEGIRAAVADGARIVEIVYKTHRDPTIVSAIDYAVAKGVIVVAQTGNDGQAGNAAIAPSDVPGVLAVGGVEQSDLGYWPESISGPQVVVVAPATNIDTAIPGGGYALRQSTSCAAALVSGTAAVVWSAHPTWTAGQVEQAIIESASGQGKRINDELGYGVVNPTAAVAVPAPAVSADPLPTAAPTASRGSAPASTHPAVVARGGGSAGGGSLLWIILGAALAVVLAAVIVLVVRRRRGPRRYALPAPAPMLNAGPMEIAARYQQNQAPVYPTAPMYQPPEYPSGAYAQPASTPPQVPAPQYPQPPYPPQEYPAGANPPRQYQDYYAPVESAEPPVEGSRSPAYPEGGAGPAGPESGYPWWSDEAGGWVTEPYLSGGTPQPGAAAPDPEDPAHPGG